MKIIVTNAEVKAVNGVSQRTGKPWTKRFQEVIAEIGQFRYPVKLTLGDVQDPHAVGSYDVDLGNSVQVNGFGDLEFRRVLVLVPNKAR